MKYKKMPYYLGLPWSYEVSFSDDPLEPWTVRIKELPGCMSHGKTAQEAMICVQEALEAYILSLMDAQESIPEPAKLEDFKGIITYRTKPDKHYRIAKEAQRLGISINKLLDQAVDTKLTG